MRREEIPAALRAFTGSCARSVRRALEALRVPERVPSALRLLAGPGARERLRLGWAAVRHRPDVALAAVLVVGVVVMIIHWS